MKKIILMLVVAIGAAVNATAQKVNISASYGGYTQMDACDMSDGIHASPAWGALTVVANFNVAPKLWIGPSYTFSSAKVKSSSSSSLYYHAILFNARYDYYRNSICTVYAHGGIGVDITRKPALGCAGEPGNSTYFAFQASPVGAEVQLSREFTIFGEAGFGAQGLLQAGFRINF